MSIRIVFVWLVTSITIATGPLGPIELRAQSNAERRWLPGEWKLVGGVPGGVESELFGPTLIRATNDQIVVVDYLDYAVKGFSFEGQLRWSSGRSGAGPREFRNPTDLQIAPDGSIWVTDPDNVRVTIFEPDGRFRQSFRFRPGLIRCAPISAEQCWAVPALDSIMATLVDTAGASGHRIPLRS